MPCRDLIDARWKIGGDFKAVQKKFARFDKTIPGLNIKIDHGDCDIEGWTVKSQYKKPGWVETDTCIYDTAIVSNNNVLFQLEGTLFGENGIWEIEATLKGPLGESRDSVYTIKYEVVETCEGTEVPPIPPESTCNTVDELIQALRDIIDEGNLANTTWNATITSGNTANDNWNLTITAGNNAQTQWNITIAAGNVANLVWLQTIADGEVLKAEIEALIAGGDLIQKGAGFDDIKYPFLKDVTDDLEEKYFALDDRLVFAFDPKNRNIENLKHGIYNKNNLTNGDGTVRSEGADSMSVVFNDVDGNVYCGEGYENLIKNNSAINAITCTASLDNHSFTLTNGTATDSRGEITLNESVTLGDKIQISIKELAFTGIVGKQVAIKVSSIIETPILYSSFVDGKAEFVVENTGTLEALLLYTGDDGDVTGEEISLVVNETQVPFVKDTANDGKLIIKEPWSLDTHSFIGVVSGTDTAADRYLFVDKNNASRINASLLSSPVTFVESSLYSIAENEGGTTGAVIRGGAGFQDGIRLGGIASILSPLYYKLFLVYEGILTEQELRDELEKIKSGKFILENTGVYEPLQGAKKRCNEYGQTKDYVMLESQSTDIQLVETDKLITTTAFDQTVRIDRIDNAGVITNISGGAGIENVGGYIRLTVATSPSASTKVKVVIEIVE